MPELYPGQATVIADKLTEAERLLQSNQEQLKATTEPEKRAALLRLIAGQGSLVGSYRRALRKAESDTDETRSESVRVRLTAAERTQVEEEAAAAGIPLGSYVRQRLGFD